jgi:hypothetical protein
MGLLFEHKRVGASRLVTLFSFAHTDNPRTVERQTVRRTRGYTFCARRDRRSLLVREIRQKQARRGQEVDS